MRAQLRAIYVKGGNTIRLTASPAWIRATALVLTAMAIVLAANAFAFVYVSAERYFYYWDWSMYWIGFSQLGDMFHRNAFLGLKYLRQSIRTDAYNFLPVFPLVPFEILGGASRTCYILAITNMGLLPSAAL